ncbi:response regulator, partial [Pontibacter populi]
MPDTKTRVLLIDDDEDDFIITRDTIEEIPGRNYVLDWTASFSEAMGLIKEEMHDVYLVDYRLGAHDGLELISQAVEGGSMAPFI